MGDDKRGRSVPSKSRLASSCCFSSDLNFRLACRACILDICNRVYTRQSIWLPLTVEHDDDAIGKDAYVEEGGDDDDRCWKEGSAAPKARREANAMVTCACSARPEIAFTSAAKI